MCKKGFFMIIKNVTYIKLFGPSLNPDHSLNLLCLGILLNRFIIMMLRFLLFIIFFVVVADIVFVILIFLFFVIFLAWVSAGMENIMPWYDWAHVMLLRWTSTPSIFKEITKGTKEGFFMVKLLWAKITEILEVLGVRRRVMMLFFLNMGILIVLRGSSFKFFLFIIKLLLFLVELVFLIFKIFDF